MFRSVLAPAAVCVLLISMLSGGCGYVGNPLPPALLRPVRVNDLVAVERGSNIVVQFTIPRVTTENLPVKGRPDIELRAGVAPAGTFNWEEWLRNSERIPVSQEGPFAHVEIPAAKYSGKTVDIAVSVHGPQGRSVGWSSFQIVPVVDGLPKPEALKASDAPDAVHLAWLAAAPEFRIFRKLVADAAWERVGTSASTSYTDATIEYGKTYEYYVQSDEKTGPATWAESDASDVVTIKPEDKFPPAVPAGLTAITGARTIELVWERNVNRDFAGYRVYRNGQKIAEDLTSPSYTDSDIKTGTKYQYQITAVDTTGNESARSAAVEIVAP